VFTRGIDDSVLVIIPGLGQKCQAGKPWLLEATQPHTESGFEMANRTRQSLSTKTGQLLMFGALGLVAACQNSTIKVSLPASAKHATELAGIVRSDVSEVRAGMPVGEHVLESLYKTPNAPRDDLERVQRSLSRARDSVQDLRVAKSTFFALVDADGTILRSDRTPDALAGKNLWTAVPEASRVMQGKIVETRGVVAEAAAVKSRPDGQWFTLVPIVVENSVRGAYVTGWSWSAYAYRLETALRDELKTQAREKSTKEPLVYVYVVVAYKAFGAPISPEVNAAAIVRAVSNVHLTGEQVWSAVIDITGREFALSVHAVPDFGSDAAIAVLRSET